MARRAVRSFRRGPRRATDWSATAVKVALAAVAGSTKVILDSFTPIAGGETVIRVRGTFGWASDQEAATEVQLGAVGICVVTEQAATIGITAVPHPNTDAAWGGWLWHSYYKSKVFFNTGSAMNFDPLHVITIDSKAMRKVDEDERLLFIIENSTGEGVDVASNFRILSKLH